MTQWIILDRDGVINEDSDQFIKSEEEWQPINGSIEAMAHLYHQGIKLAVATNQSGIARGYFSEHTLTKMHDKLATLLKQHNAQVETIVHCPHGPDDQCHCRKPKDGLFRKIANSFHLDLHTIPAVGDSLRDLQAAYSCGCQPVLVLTGKGKKTLNTLNQPTHLALYRCTWVYPDLKTFSQNWPGKLQSR